VVVELTANHKGWMEFRLCQNDFPTERMTQDCFDEHVLQLADSRVKRFIVPDQNGYQKISFRLVLPPHVRCRACVLQWKYNAGNSWGTDAGSGRGCIGCGNQEQFYGCSDIAIGYDVEIPKHKTLPADMEADDKNKSDSQPEMPPPWKPEEDNNNNNVNWGENDIFDKPDKREHTGPGKKAKFDFVHVNNDGMRPCMCICRKPPLRMGSPGTDMQATFFDGMDQEASSQACMCMCQASGSQCPLISGSLLISAFILVFAFLKTFS